ncbi:hypothetical protein AB0F91_45115 [Amycolatopsis sp. NPDC023774]|uniref:hypothetical protein n=1 Tax=Amycolatopsis sp. NPDC023774 TaxID=3155015 RepID=UPI0033FB7A85
MGRARLVSGRARDLEIVHCLQVVALYYVGAPAGSDVLFDQLRQEGDRIVAKAREQALSVDAALAVRTEVLTDAPRRWRESRRSRRR